MKIENRGGLLFTSVEIIYKGKTKVVENVVIDTGASQSLISQDSVSEIGIKVESEDEIVTTYGIGGKEHAFVKHDKCVWILHGRFPIGYFGFFICGYKWTFGTRYNDRSRLYNRPQKYGIV
jgi:hypothetical protein